MTDTNWRDEEWRESALCRQVDPELWFPEKGDAGNEAKRVCGRCPVEAECLEFAIQTVQRAGIWGGKGERDLRKIRFQRGLSGPAKRVPVARVYALADLGWAVGAIAVEVGFRVDSLRRVLKLRPHNEGAAA